MDVLPRSKGFSQPFYGEIGPTPYLPATELNLHRSTVTIRRIREDVESFGNPIDLPPYLIPLNLRYAINAASKAFRISEQPLLHLNDVFRHRLNIWSSAPGLPWKQLGYKTKRDVIKDHRAQRQIRWFWHKIKNGEHLQAPDCQAFVRSHICETDVHKTRAVWGYPMTMTMGEAVFAVPLIEKYQALKGVSCPIAYGYETAIGGSRRLAEELRTYRYKAAVDFSSFDKTVPIFLIREAFNILALNLDFLNYREHGVADVRRTILMYEYIQHYFIHTPIRLCDGQRRRKHGGVASGSYFTQLIDSVVNYILISWAFIQQHGRLPSYIKVLGDDSIVGDNLRLDLDDASDLFATIGMSINIRKSMVSRDLSNMSFLGYNIDQQGVPSKSHDKWMSSLYLPERPDRSWDDVATRALGLLYANCGIDSAFDRYCRAILNYREFDLAISRSMRRMLYVVGVTYIDPKPPDIVVLWRRIRIF